MNKALKIIVELLLLVVIAGLVVAIVKSIQQPVNFNKAQAQREQVAIQRLKDIRSLEVAYNSVNGKYTADFDSLFNFYRNGQMDVIMQIGSNDDSLAVANTEALRKRNRNITPQEMYQLYKQGERLVFSITNKVNVRDTLFNDRPGYEIDSLRYIPFSGKQKTQLDAVVKTVSGVPVPLFEAKMPYKALLKGLDNQLRINLDADRRASNRYEGLMVGSVSAPNNNAGNWE